VHDIERERGGHAHRDTTQVVTAIAGKFEMILTDGFETRSFILDDITRGLLIQPMLFIRMQAFSPNARVMVMASTHYDSTRSIRSWEGFLDAIAVTAATPP
jgi:hypothetical protein